MQKLQLASLFSPFEKDLQELEESFLFLKDESPEIYNDLKKTTLAGGKRLRPLLVFISCDIFGLNQKDALILASASEMIHAASLCHDDVLDDAKIRRDLPTLNVLKGNKQAILSGDFLFSLALKNLCQLKNMRTVESASQMIAALSQGEWTQEQCRQTKNYPEGIIEQIALAKTASLFSWAFQAPALCAHATSEEEELARTIGRELGLAFQMVDDIIDYSSDSGKEPFIDLKRGVLNSVSWEYFNERNILKDYESGRINPEELCQVELFKTALLTTKAKAQKHIQDSREAFARLLALKSKSSKDKRLELFQNITHGLLNKI